MELTTALAALGAQVLQRGVPATQTVGKHHCDACRAGGKSGESPGHVYTHLLHIYHLRCTGEMYTHAHTRSRRECTRESEHPIDFCIQFLLLAPRSAISIRISLDRTRDQSQTPAFLPFHFLPFHSSTPPCRRRPKPILRKPPLLPPITVSLI